MAATIVNQYPAQIPHHVTIHEISTIQAGAQFNITHGGPSGVVPFRVYLQRVVTEATSGCPVFLEWIGYSAANNTVTVRLDTEPGGDLTGATVRVHCEFIAHASGGLTNVA